ncbi:hypothetical protein BT93_F2241 [Corymbia citriodora subsp. variegata]|nr:hypothetical protein BT93_F2241 [Corymbia citriodora subsp. variegata]
MAPCLGLVSTFLLALLVIQVIEFGDSISSTNVSCIGAEREALLKFKHGLSDPWRRLSSWIAQSPYPCIEDIDMLEPSNKCRLGGNIVPSLTELKYLKYLDLSVNNFSAQKMPTFLASLQKLEYLNLSYAGFDGDIPRQLNNLSKLQYLDLSNDFILGHLCLNDLDWLSKLSSLRYLHMSGVGLSKAKDWFGSINMLSSLQYLQLSNCELQDISSSLQANFTSLRFLTIESNNLSYILPWTYNLSKLEHIDLSDNFHMKGPFPTAIIENNQRLAFFDVSLDLLQGEFPKNMSNLCKLQVVRLSNNYFNGKISVISNGPRSCVWSKWKIFDVSSNNCSGDLPNQFGDFKELEFLDLSLNSISGSIPTNLGELSSLRELHLHNNKLSGTIPESIGRLSNLKELRVQHNFLYGVVSNLHFENLKSLTSLDISSNELTLNVSSTWVPPFQVHEIDLSNCEVGPGFPKWLQTQRNINSLTMSNASILDDILDWLYDISANITHLDISSNMLIGQVSQDIGDKIPWLTVLRLWGNNLTGGISSSLNNELTGRLPPFGKHFQSLAMINFEKNHFVGGIPSQFCQLRYLRFLSLAQNNIFGPIPNCIDGFLSMVDSTLYYEDWPYEDGLNVMVNTKGTSQMYGDVISYFFSIDLSANMLSRPEPRARDNPFSWYHGISNMDFLSHLNLSFNKLSGPIPSGNHLRTVDDESVYRSNDGLCGAPLSKICPGDEPPGRDGRKSDNSNGDRPSKGNLDIHNWFYAGLGPGFTVGFLGFCSILHFNRSWRISYSRAMDRAFEEFSMTMMITMLWLKRKIQQRE